MIQENLIPPSFMAEMSAALGSERAETLISALDSEPETAVRINVRKSLDSFPFEGVTPVGWCPSGFYLSSRPKFTFDPLLHAGAYYVQDPSSMVYQSVVSAIVGQRPVAVADLCAAPGGKTTAILNAIPDGSVVLANEFEPSRVKILKENLVKYGYPHVVVTNSDVSRIASLGASFDIVAVDAPCSGEGMMRKEPVARSQWSPGLVAQCSALQREILDDAVLLIRPGGYLIYSTCTFNTSEDEENAAYIVDHLGLEPVDTGLAGTAGIQPGLSSEVPSIRFMPGFARGEGLFLALFRKPEDAESVSYSGGKSPKSRQKAAVDKRIISEAGRWVLPGFDIREHDGRLLALSDGVASILDRIPKGVRILSAGVEVAEIKGKDLVPSHPLALSLAMAKDAFPEVELSLQDALAYLRREAVSLPAGTPKGFVVATYRGLPLGFMKNIGSRANNLYPAEWRIRSRQ